MKANNEVGGTACEQTAPGRRQPELGKEVIKTGEIIFNHLWESMVGTRDITREMLPGMKKEKYTNVYTYPENGWVVSKLLFPDIATNQGEGYHRVAIVASTAETAAGVDKAIEKGIQTKTILENGKAHITAETIIVLSSNISFKLANELRRVFSNEHRTVFIYSVKNRIGVAKNALKAFGNLFTVRAKKILDLPGDLSEKMQVLAETLRKRGEKLLGSVSKLAKLLERIVTPKRELKKAKDAAYLYLSKLREWGLRIYVKNEEYEDIDALYDRINYTAQIQNIDAFEMEQAEMKRTLDRLSSAKVGKSIKEKPKGFLPHPI